VVRLDNSALKLSSQEELCKFCKPENISSDSFILASCTSFRSVTNGLQRPSPRVCTLDHASIFVVNISRASEGFFPGGGKKFIFPHVDKNTFPEMAKNALLTRN